MTGRSAAVNGRPEPPRALFSELRRARWPRRATLAKTDRVLCWCESHDGEAGRPRKSRAQCLRLAEGHPRACGGLVIEPENPVCREFFFAARTRGLETSTELEGAICRCNCSCRIWDFCSGGPYGPGESAVLWPGAMPTMSRSDRGKCLTWRRRPSIDWGIPQYSGGGGEQVRACRVRGEDDGDGQA